MILLEVDTESISGIMFESNAALNGSATVAEQGPTVHEVARRPWMVQSVG